MIAASIVCKRRTTLNAKARYETPPEQDENDGKRISKPVLWSNRSEPDRQVHALRRFGDVAYGFSMDRVRPCDEEVRFALGFRDVVDFQLFVFLAVADACDRILRKTEDEIACVPDRARRIGLALEVHPPTQSGTNVPNK